MIYRIVTYSRADEKIRGSRVIPGGLVSWVKRVAGFAPEDDGLGEYLLNEDQVRKIAPYIGFKPELEDFYYYIEPYDPPVATGLEPAE